MSGEVEPATGYGLGYEDAMKWAGGVARSEARWQTEQAMRGEDGARAIAERVLVLAQIFDDALGRMAGSRVVPDGFVFFDPEAATAPQAHVTAPLSASGAESDHGGRRDGEGLG